MTRLSELVEESGKMKKDISAELGYPPQTFSNYIRETRELDHDGIRKVCGYFGCTSDYLLGMSSFRLPAVPEKQARFLDAYDALPPAIREAVDGLMAPYMVTAEKKKA